MKGLPTLIINTLSHSIGQNKNKECNVIMRKYNASQPATLRKGKMRAQWYQYVIEQTGTVGQSNP